MNDLGISTCLAKPQKYQVSELLQQAMPLMGPNFDPERDIEDFSDDSSCEDGLD